MIRVGLTCSSSNIVENKERARKKQRPEVRKEEGEELRGIERQEGGDIRTARCT